MNLHYNNQFVSTLDVSRENTIGQIKKLLNDWLVPQGVTNYTIQLQYNDGRFLAPVVFETNKYDANLVGPSELLTGGYIFITRVNRVCERVLEKVRRLSELDEYYDNLILNVYDLLYSGHEHKAGGFIIKSNYLHPELQIYSPDSLFGVIDEYNENNVRKKWDYENLSRNDKMLITENLLQERISRARADNILRNYPRLFVEELRTIPMTDNQIREHIRQSMRDFVRNSDEPDYMFTDDEIEYLLQLHKRVLAGTLSIMVPVAEPDGDNIKPTCKFL